MRPQSPKHWSTTPTQASIETLMSHWCIWWVLLEHLQVGAITMDFTFLIKYQLGFHQRIIYWSLSILYLGLRVFFLTIDTSGRSPFISITTVTSIFFLLLWSSWKISKRGPELSGHDDESEWLNVSIARDWWLIFFNSPEGKFLKLKLKKINHQREIVSFLTDTVLTILT
jgi:hypothetical protein